MGRTIFQLLTNLEKCRLCILLSERQRVCELKDWSGKASQRLNRRPKVYLPCSLSLLLGSSMAQDQSKLLQPIYLLPEQREQEEMWSLSHLTVTANMGRCTAHLWGCCLLPLYSRGTHPGEWYRAMLHAKEVFAASIVINGLWIPVYLT